MAKTLYIIDGHAHIYAAYYAPMRPLTSPAGEPTKATYIFTTAILGLIEKQKPDMLVVAMDSKGRGFRADIYPEYKAHRQPMPEDMPVQIDRITQILKAMRIPVISVENYEADDIIGTLTLKAAQKGFKSFICSKDKDMLQLLDDNTCMYDIKKDVITDTASMKSDMGLDPHQFIDVLALQGDTADNIPGVPDIGPKTAIQWIQKYRSLDNLFENADEIKGKRGDNLRSNKDKAMLSRELVIINRKVPLKFSEKDFSLKEPDKNMLAQVFTELDFGRLLSQMGLKKDEKALEEMKQQAPAVNSSKEIKKDYKLVDNETELRKFLAKLKKQKLIAIDTETTSTDPMSADLVGMSFSWKPGQAWYLPVKSPLGQNRLDIKAVRSEIGPILKDPETKKIGQNIKYDIHILTNALMPVEGICFDTMVASYCLYSDQRSHSMDSMAKDFLGIDTIPITSLIGKGKNQLTFDMVDLEAAAEYAAEDADITFRLYEFFNAELEKIPELKKLFNDIEMPLLTVLARMEHNGVSLDVKLLKKLSQTVSEELDKITDKIHALSGTVFNIDSPKQLSEVLFDNLGLKSVKSGKTMRSTDAGVLEQLLNEHEIIPLILQYRQYGKLKNTYLDKLPKSINSKTNRLHASFNQTVTATGRLSSSDPNLQNIPIRTDIGRRIRAAFIPENKIDCILSADYSQIELRLLAHFSRDKALMKAFSEDKDIHRFVASQVYDIKPELVTGQMRSNAKAVNFGIIYGQGPYGLSRTIGISQSDAKKFIDDYYARYSSIRKFMDDAIETAKKYGYAETIMGRRREIYGLESRNFNTRSHAERMTINTVIQGSAADLIKIAMINIQKYIDQEQLPVKMILQIHDELVFELPKTDAVENEKWISREMANALKLDVPMKIDTSIGQSWLTDK